MSRSPEASLREIAMRIPLEADHRARVLASLPNLPPEAVARALAHFERAAAAMESAFAREVPAQAVVQAAQARRTVTARASVPAHSRQLAMAGGGGGGWGRARYQPRYSPYEEYADDDMPEHAVANLGLAEFGRREISLAETQMPGLMALRTELGPSQPLNGARITGALHMTVQTAVLIETLIALGAKVRWTSCNIYSTQDHAAAALAARGVPIFAMQGESLAEYWEFIGEALDWGDETADMILDDGGDSALFALWGAKFEAGVGFFEPENDEEVEFQEALRAFIRRRPGVLTRTVDHLKGVVEDTTTGVHRLYQLAIRNELPFPAINVNDSVTKSKFDNLYSPRESIVDAIRRATDVMIAGKVACVAGFGDVGKGCADGLRKAGARVLVTEIDPICALQAATEGYAVVTMEEASETADIFVTATGNVDVITIEHMKAMKPMAIVCNIGHFDSEIQIAALSNYHWREVKPGTDLVEFPDGKEIIILARGRLVNYGCATGPSAFILSVIFTNLVLAQVELWTKGDRYNNQVYVLPKHLDEKAAELHLRSLGAQLSRLTYKQAYYIGVRVEGPFKPDHYRY